MKKFTWIILFVLLIGLVVPSASADGIVNAPPENLNIVVLNDLNTLTNFDDLPGNEDRSVPYYTDEWGGSTILGSVLDEDGNKLIRLENEITQFSIPGFMNNLISQPLQDYAIANPDTDFWGVAMYVRTEEDFDVDFWQMGFVDQAADGPATMSTGAYLYDMNGELYASHEDGESLIESGTGVVIPCDFEGYLIITYPETVDYKQFTYMVWWMYAPAMGALIIDNIGLCVAEPTAPTTTPTETPATEAPTTAPATEAPVTPTLAESPTSVPTTNSPSAEAPTTSLSVTEQASSDPASPDWLLIGIIAAVVIILGFAVFFIIKGKKAKA